MENGKKSYILSVSEDSSKYSFAYDCYKNYREKLPVPVPINVSAKIRLKSEEKSDELSHKTLVKSKDMMRAVVGQDVFVFQVLVRVFPDWRTSTPRSLAYSRIRAHTRARHYFSSEVLHPS